MWKEFPLYVVAKENLISNLYECILCIKKDEEICSLTYSSQFISSGPFLFF